MNATLVGTAQALAQDIEEFYDPELYALEVGNSYGRSERNRFYLDACAGLEGAVLELGCGTGDVLLAFAEAGLDIVGLDLSQRMLAYCRKRVAALDDAVRLRIRVEQGDMRFFQLQGEFSAVLVPYHCMWHMLTGADLRACLARIRRHLPVGGLLMFDVCYPHCDWSGASDTLNAAPRSLGERRLADGTRVSVTERVVQAMYTGILRSHYTYAYTAPHGAVTKVERNLLYRVASFAELELQLELAGFDETQLRHAPSLGRSEYFVTARAAIR